MTISEKYRFYIRWNLQEIEVVPYNPDLTVQKEYNETGLMYSESISESVVLRGEGFEFIKTVVDGVSWCVPIVFAVVDRITSQDVLLGTIWARNCKYDLTKCIVTCPVVLKSKATYIAEASGIETNILTVPNKHKYYTGFQKFGKSYFEYYETENAEQLYAPLWDQSIPLTILPPGSGWMRTYEKTYVVAVVGGTVFGRVKNKWIREIWVNNAVPPSPELGFLFSSSESIYYRTIVSILKDESIIETTYDIAYLTGEPTYTGTRIGHEQSYHYSPLDAAEIDNAVHLFDILERFESVLDVEIRSNLFGYKPSGASPATDPYTLYSQQWSNCLFNQASDVTKANAESNATNWPWSFESFLQLLQNWKIRAHFTGNDLRIEHISYFWSEEENDLTLNNGLVGTDVFRYKYKNTPLSDIYSHTSESVGFLFQRCTFSYKAIGNCQNSFVRSREFQALELSTDVASLLANPLRFSDQGYTMVFYKEFDGKKYVTCYQPSGLQTHFLNGFASAYLLTKRFCLYENMAAFGSIYTPFIGTEIISSNTVEPLKLQEDFTVKSFQFDAVKLQKGLIGWGRVLRSSESLLACKIKLSLQND